MFLKIPLSSFTAILCFSSLFIEKYADAAINPIKNKGSKIVDNINVLFLTLVRYSLLMISQTLFMIYLLNLFRIAGFRSLFLALFLVFVVLILLSALLRLRRLRAGRRWGQRERG